MSEQTKVTRKDLFFRIAAAMSDDEEVVSMCEKYIEQLSRKHPVKPKPEVEEFRSEILNILWDANEPMTNKQICEVYRSLGKETSAQKTAAALRWLVTNGHAVSYEPQSKSGVKTYEAERPMISES